MAAAISGSIGMSNVVDMAGATDGGAARESMHRVRGIRPNDMRRAASGQGRATAPSGSDVVRDEVSHRRGRRVPRGSKNHPAGVSHQTIHPATKRAVIIRLRRVEGQVSGLQRMVEDDRDCVDVLTQINAVRAALHKVESVILRDHVSHCVAHAFTSGDAIKQGHRIEELVKTIDRMRKG